MSTYGERNQQAKNLKKLKKNFLMISELLVLTISSIRLRRSFRCVSDSVAVVAANLKICNGCVVTLPTLQLAFRIASRTDVPS
jgi:hypothetical protein